MSNFPLLPAEPSLFSKKALHMSVNKAQYQSKHRQTDGLTDVIITADDLVCPECCQWLGMGHVVSAGQLYCLLKLHKYEKR